MIKRKKKAKKEQYSVIFTSETDARKKSASFTVKRRTIVAAMAVIISLVLGCVAVVAVSIYHVSLNLTRTQGLKYEIDDQAKAMSSYESELDFLQDALGD
jgi:cell division protein FtsL